MINTKGAALKLGYSVIWVQKLVQRGKLKAYVYNNVGECVLHDPKISQKGRELFFQERDLKAYNPRKAGRPAGSPDKAPRRKA